MPLFINSVSYTSADQSPKSVLHHSAPPAGKLETLVLNSSALQPPAHSIINTSRESTGVPELSGEAKRPRNAEPWLCQASKRSRLVYRNSLMQSVVGQVTRRIKLGCQRKDRKAPLSLASGDATAGGNLTPCAAAVEVVVKACLEGPHAAAYTNACGTLEARVAIAKHHSYPELQIGPEDVIVANGCSGALDLAFQSLLEEGTTVLVPQPGFPLYEDIAKSIGASVVHYHLNPEQSWECDIEHLESIMLSHRNVRAIVVNNPGASTGAVFSEKHLTSIANFALAHQLPIIADEIYGDLTFGSNRFVPMAQVAARLGRQVPVVTASGISKQFLLPGWRVGWLAFHDNIHHSLWQIKAGATSLAQLNHGTSNLAQAAVPTLLDPSTPGLAHWRETLRLNLQGRSEFLCGKLNKCPGLQVITSQGAMYATIAVDTSKLEVENDLEFAMRLVDEENVFVLPGMAMGVQNIIRVSLCSPERLLDAAACRIERFCHRHARQMQRPTE